MTAALEAVERVKGALDRTGVGAISHYLIRGGAISAQSPGLFASAPFPWPGEALVAGVGFEGVVQRMPGEPTFSVVELATAEESLDDAPVTALRIKAGKFKGDVRTLDVSYGPAIPVPDREGARKLDAELVARLRALCSFVSDDPNPAWMNCLVIQRGRACAVGPGGHVFAMAPVPDFGAEALIPKRALAIAFSGALPDRLLVTDNHASFFWDDGAWLRSQLVVGKIPAIIETLAEKAVAGAVAPEITPEWREAFERVSSFATDEVAIHADRIVGRSGAAEVEEAVRSPVPEGKTATKWSSVLLRAVVAEAERFDPAAGQAPFAGPRVKGLVVGRS